MGTARFDHAGFQLHHVAVVVGNLDAAMESYAALGFAGAERSLIAGQGVEVVTYPAGAGWIELISPVDPDGPIARYMAKRGEGLHHVAFRVGDLGETLAALDEAGVRLIDRQPRQGAHGWRVAFIHPESCNGVLTELVEDGRT